MLMILHSEKENKHTEKQIFKEDIYFFQEKKKILRILEYVNECILSGNNLE